MSQQNFEEMDVNDLTIFCTQKYSEKNLIDAELKKATPILFTKMKECEIPEVKSPFGRYYETHSTKYIYSEATQKLAEELAVAQEREKAEKVAQKIETPGYKFGKLKKEDEQF